MISDVDRNQDEDNTYGPFTMRAFLTELGASYTEVDGGASENLLIYNVENQTAVGKWEFTTRWERRNWSPIYLMAAQVSASGSELYGVAECHGMHQIRYEPNANTFTTGTDLPFLSVRAWDSDRKK